MASFDHSTWLAKRAGEIPADGLPEPTMVTLPGARQPIAVDMLHAHQALGRDQHQIVARINADWRTGHAAQLAEHDRWTSGPYHDAIVELQQRDQQARAAELRRQAVFQRLTGRDA
jgi:hypothetical protein